MKSEAILELLKKNNPHITEAYSTQNFEVVLSVGDEGFSEAVAIQLHDAGPGVDNRYWIRATARSGKKAFCNPAPTIETAISSLSLEKLRVEG